MNQAGTLEIIIGPMFSGKTTLINQRLANAEENGLSCLKVVHSSDLQRSELYRKSFGGNQELGSTHNHCYNSLPQGVVVVGAEILSTVEVSDYEVIAVDEGQFFSDLDLVCRWVDAGKIVIVASLDGDYRKNPFGRVLDLIPKADKCSKVSAICRRCIQEQIKLGIVPNLANFPAPFTRRIVSSEQVRDIGGADKYEAVCRRHSKTD